MDDYEPMWTGYSERLNKKLDREDAQMELVLLKIPKALGVLTIIVLCFIAAH